MLPPIQVEPHVGEEPYTWKHCRGWLSEAEATMLARLASGKKVLEIGTFYGKSTVAMAEGAKHIVCVDPFTGYPGTEFTDTLKETVYNLRSAGVRDKVHIHVGTQEEVLPEIDLSEFDMVFYDADHSEESTARGIKLLFENGLPERATVAFHDYHGLDPGVVRAVNGWSLPKGLHPKVTDSLAVFDMTVPENVQSHDVMLAIPTNGQTLTYGAAQGLFRASWTHRVQINHHDKSLLSAAFNKLWCDALNAFEAGEITHLAFLHADINPGDGWIDMLIHEMDDAYAAVCSAVSPIKDQRGLTSTGLGELGLQWSPLRRFTMKEVLDFPVTFDAGDAGHPEKVLLVNSGCWVADLRHPAFRIVHSNGESPFYFTINDRVVREKESGKWTHQVESEDWFFSRQLFSYGVRAVATTRVPIVHVGMSGYRNDVVWGAQETDEDLRPLWDAKEVG
jgi:hypothetical protein